MVEKNEEHPLRELLAKINHPLLDVRSRSLRSVSFKLSTGLLHITDMVHERDFLAHLLEWFNFEEVVMEAQALSLISQVAEHEAAAQIFVEIGGVEFLSQLRLYSDPSLHPLIDEVLEQLLKLPQSAADALDSETAPPKYRGRGASLPSLATANPPSDSSNGERLQGDSSDQGSNVSEIPKPSNQRLQSAVAFSSSGELSQGSSNQQTFTTESTTDYGSYLQISKQSFGLTDESEPYTGLPPQYLERTFSVSTSAQSNASGSTSSLSVETSESQRFGKIGQKSQPCILYTVSPAVPTSVEMKSEGSARTEADGEYFPWLKLSLNDRHILATTDSRLQGSTADGLIKSCEFIQDVLFQDFPTELFLQRPSLIKSLLKLLVHGNAEGTHQTVLHCLLELTAHLHQRLALYSDPAMGVTDQLTLPATINKQVTSSGTAPDHLPQSHDLPPQSHDFPLQSCDLPSQSHDLPPQSHDLEQLTEDMLLFLQSEQVSLEQYCHSVIASVTPLLLGYLNKHIPQLRGNGELKVSDSSSSCRPLPVYIALCLQLLGAVVGLLEQLRRHTGTPQSSHRNGTLGMQSVESLAFVLSQCLSKWRRFGTPAQPSCPQLQLVCWTTLHLASCLGKLLDMQGPYASSTIAASTVSVLHDLMMSGVIAVACPQLHQTLQPHFDKLDTASSALLQKIKRISIAFEKMSSFLSCIQHSGDKPHELLVQLATEGLPGLWFHCNEDFTTASLKLCIGILMNKDRSSEWNSASVLLLKLLSHESDSVKELAYKYLKDHILKAIAELKQHPTETTRASKITILPLILSKEVLEEVCCHGSMSKVGGVASAACEILGSLVILREELFWPELLESLLQWMPYIEVCMSTNENICKHVQELLSSKESGISDAVRLQSYLRLLFSTSNELQVWAFTELSKLLLSEDGGKLSPYPLPTSVTLHDILTLGEKKATQSVHDINRSGTFQPDDVVKLLHILRSPVMDTLLKKTALEQLAILLNDRSLHEPALGEGIITDLVLALKIALQSREDGELKSAEEPSLLLKPSIQCLQLLANSGATLRVELAADCSFLLDIFRATLLLHKDMESLHSASKLLASLVFGPASVFPSPGGGIKLPESLLNRLRIPWQVDLYQSECRHSTPSPLAPSLLSSDPTLSMLRLHYHVAMQGSVEKLLKTQDFVTQSHAENEKLRIPSGDLLALKAMHLQSSCIDCFKSLQAASSHDGVRHLLHSFSVLLQVCGNMAKGRKTANVDSGLQLEWNEVLERFLTVQPTTPEDISLLTSVLQFIYDLLSVPASAGLLVGPAQLEWLVETTAGHGTVCLQLLHSSLQCVEHRHSIDPYRCLQKTLLKYLSSLMKRMASEQDSAGSFDPLALVEVLCQCLDVAGSPNYYDLPILESSLECLLHLTASSCMKRTSTPEWMALLLKLMTSLRQVLWSFISGRGSMLASFMGKGVTSRAALSLCHLLQTSSKLSPPEGWWMQWVQSAPDVGLSWLHSLVEDREPQVQYAGMSMLASLCTLPSLVELVLGDWVVAGHSFGLWGVCLQTALGQECSLVRQQAFFVLVSLSALCSKEKKWDQYLTYNSDEVSVHGLRALELLLESCSFFPSLQTLVQTQSLSKLKQKFPLIRTTMDSCLTGQLPKYGKGDVIQSSNKTGECLSEVLGEVLRCCDPHVVTGACKLVHNLLLAFPETLGVHILTHSTIGTLISAVDVQLLGLLLVGDNSSAVSSFQRSSWVRMCTDAVSLLKVAVMVLQPDVSLPHLLREDVVASLCKILSLVRALESSMEDPECLSLCSAVMALLQVIVERVPSSKAEVVFCCLQLHWNSFTGLLHYSLCNASTSKSTLRANSLRLFCSLLVHRFQPDTGRTADSSGATNPSREPLVAALGHLLDGRGRHHPGGSRDEENQTISYLSTDSESGTLEQLTTTSSHEEAPPTGSILCEALLKAYDGTFSRMPVQTQDNLNTEGRQLVGESLGILLACSTAAKQTALSAGLLESSTELLKTLHSKLCMESLEQVAHQNKKGKESALMSEIISLVNLLRSFMYTSAEVKLQHIESTSLLHSILQSAALGCHLPAMMQKLWPWCTVTRRLLLAVLKLLTCFTAQHARGQTSLASSVVKGASNSLLHGVIKLATHSITGYNSCNATKMANPHGEVLRAVFTLLANCALSSECRGVMKKTAFLTGFTSVNPNSEKTAHGRTRLSLLWLRLLINLSFSTEGQQMLVKLPGSLDVLLDIHQYGNPENQTQCLLILRNLCFFGPSKTLLVSNENFLRLLSVALESEDKKEITLAASAVWALLHNCSKIKNSLKKSELAEKLGNIHFSVKPDQPTTTGPSTDELLYRTAVTQAQTLLH